MSTTRTLSIKRVNAPRKQGVKTTMRDTRLPNTGKQTTATERKDN
jgi:hypothetical protein